MLQPVSEGNERAVCESMITGCQQALATFPTTLADDMRLNNRGTVEEGTCLDVALRVRMVRCPTPMLSVDQIFSIHSCCGCCHAGGTPCMAADVCMVCRLRSVCWRTWRPGSRHG